MVSLSSTGISSEHLKPNNIEFTENNFDSSCIIIMESSVRTFGVSSLGNCQGVWCYRKLLFTIGPDWKFNVAILGILAVILAFYSTIVFPEATLTMNIVGYSVLGLNFISYLLLALVNPGIIWYGPTQMEIIAGYTTFFCQKCGIYQDPGIDHCDDCNLCIRRIDHHCPLIGKCVSYSNLWLFYTFIFSTVGVILIMMVWAFGTVHPAIK